MTRDRRSLDLHQTRELKPHLVVYGVGHLRYTTVGGHRVSVFSKTKATSGCRDAAISTSVNSLRRREARGATWPFPSHCLSP